jgi:hypothetical protein
MAEPSRIEYAVGKTIHGQMVTLIWERDYMRRDSWRIHRAELNQRDEPGDIYGLPDEVILAMADAVRRRRETSHGG